jgi:hypothetical protein
MSGKQEKYKEACDMKTKDYKSRTSQHTTSLVLKNYSDDNIGVWW